MGEHENIPGKITVEPEVLETIARLTARGVPGVAALPDKEFERFLGIDKTVEVQVCEGRVTVEVHLFAKPDISLLQLGRAIQHEVTRAIQKMIGMPVDAVNVYIEDVIYQDLEEKALAF